MYVPKKTLLASHRFTCNVSATFQHLWRRSSIYCYICYLWTNTYRLGNWQLSRLIRKSSLREKCPYLELFWSAFRRIGTKYGEIPRISPYSVRMLEKTDRNYYEYGHFLLCVWIIFSHCPVPERQLHVGVFLVSLLLTLNIFRTFF